MRVKFKIQIPGLSIIPILYNTQKKLANIGQLANIDRSEIWHGKKLWPIRGIYLENEKHAFEW